MDDKNYGLLIEKELSPFDWIAGGVSGAERSVLRENGDYSDLVPETEKQSNSSFDTMACVTFSALNCLETLARFHGIRFNKSDRFTAKMSGTTKRGNYTSIVADTIRKDGTVDEVIWPFQRDKITDWDTYYQDIPQVVQSLGKKFLEDWEITWEWVPVSRIREMLKYGPIQVIVQAWPKPNAQGIYENKGEGSNYNHAVMLYKGANAGDVYEIADHYDRDRKKLSPDYKFGSAVLFTLRKKQLETTPKPMLENNILVQNVEGNGAFGMHLNGKIMLGPNGDVLATVMMRSPRKTIDGVSYVLLRDPKPLKKADWDALPKVNLKNEPINE